MDAVPALGALLMQRRHLAAEAGIVDEDVETAELLLGGGDHAANVRLIRDIGVNSDRRITDGGRHVVLLDR